MEKTVKIKVCDFCVCETGLYECEGCGKDICSMHMARITLPTVLTGDRTMSGGKKPNERYYCLECVSKLKNIHLKNI